MLHFTMRNLCAVFVLVLGLFGFASAQRSWTLDPALEMPGPRVQIQAAKDTQGRIYIPGGTPGGGEDSEGTVFRLDESTREWSLLAELRVPRNNAGVVADSQGRIYVFGGSARDGSTLSSVERYNPSQDIWDFVRELPRAIAGAKAVSDLTGENIYLLGGGAGLGPIASVYRYNVAANAWTEEAPMQFSRVQHGAALGRNGKIYVAGGYGTASGGPDSTGGTAECYDPKTKEWTQIASMNSHPHQVGAVASDSCGFIYVIGGWNPGYTDAVERYDPSNNIWEPFPSLSQARNNFAAISGNSGKLYVFGGDADFVAQNSVEFNMTCVLPLEPTILDQFRKCVVPAEIECLFTLGLIILTIVSENPTVLEFAAIPSLFEAFCNAITGNFNSLIRWFFEEGISRDIIGILNNTTHPLRASLVGIAEGLASCMEILIRELCGSSSFVSCIIDQFRETIIVGPALGFSRLLGVATGSPVELEIVDSEGLSLFVNLDGEVVSELHSGILSGKRDMIK